MKVSIIMPIYNERATLQEVVQRVLAAQPGVELVCVDDGSNDRSRELLVTIARQCLVVALEFRLLPFLAGCAARQCGSFAHVPRLQIKV